MLPSSREAVFFLLLGQCFSFSGLWSRIPGFFIRLRKFNWISFYTALLSLTWYKFFWNFYWNREFLLCTTISIDCQLLQNRWQPNFTHVMLRGRKCLERSMSGISPPTPQPCSFQLLRCVLELRALSTAYPRT